MYFSCQQYVNFAIFYHFYIIFYGTKVRKSLLKNNFFFKIFFQKMRKAQ